MNQILSTERENYQEKKEKKVKTSNNESQLSVRTIAKFFAIVLIIFGIALSGNGAYVFYQSTQSGTVDVVKPSIQIEREDNKNIKIIVSSNIELKNVIYSINGESKTVEGQNQKNINIPIELSEGSNDIIITATDIKKQESKYQKTIDVKVGPVITLEQENQSIKVTVKSEEKIDNIKYDWDNENPKQEMIGNNEYQTSIEVISGEHTLNLEAIDINGNKSTKTLKVIGDNAPIVEVTTNRVDFVIEASDDEEITKVEINFNGEQQETEEINSKTYSKKLKLIQGENKVIIVVYNKNGITTTKKVRYELK